MKAYVSRTETLSPSCSIEGPTASIISPVIVRELAELRFTMAVEFTTPQPESHVSMENTLGNDIFLISDGNMRRNTAAVAVIRHLEFVETIFKMNKQ